MSSTVPKLHSRAPNAITLQRLRYVFVASVFNLCPFQNMANIIIIYTCSYSWEDASFVSESPSKDKASI